MTPIGLTSKKESRNKIEYNMWLLTVSNLLLKIGLKLIFQICSNNQRKNKKKSKVSKIFKSKLQSLNRRKPPKQLLHLQVLSQEGKNLTFGSLLKMIFILKNKPPINNNHSLKLMFIAIIKLYLFNKNQCCQ